MAATEKTHDIEGLRITMRCDAGHEQTFEVAAFAPWIPVHCPQCPWHTLWRQVDEEDFTMKLPLPNAGETSRARSLRDAKNPDGSPRFHPPGQHPANAADRAQYAKLKELHDLSPTRSTEALEYLERKMAEFEAGQAAAKRYWLARNSE